VELAELQDREVGDGTTSVVIVAAELLKVSFHSIFFFLPFYLHLFLQSHVYRVFYLFIRRFFLIQSMYNAFFILFVICIESK
jgi:hypothetical protein